MEKVKIKSFEDLECWKACVEVRKKISLLVKKFPADEKYDLCDNIRRAARSTTRNIAEGYGRFHFKENAQFTRHSRGSLFEIIDDLITAKDENYINESEFTECRNLIEKALALVNGYINYLNKAQELKKQSTMNN